MAGPGLTRREFLKDSALAGTGWAAIKNQSSLPANARSSSEKANEGKRVLEEPSYELAVTEWPDQLRPIIFIGCKDHLDEFGVMWNGNLTFHTETMIDADRLLVKKRPDPSLQVSFAVGDKPDYGNRTTDDGTTIPSLAEGHLPMPRIRIHRQGVTLLQESLAASADSTCHVSGWNSPVFLRQRFTVEDPGSGSSPIRLWAQLASNHIHYAMETRRNVRILPVAPLYHSNLHAAGNELRDADDRIVVFASRPFRFYRKLPGKFQSVALRYAQLDRNLAMFELPRTQGATVELIFPFIPAEPALMGSLRSSDYERSSQTLSESWKNELSHGTQIEVPEEQVNNLRRFAVPLTFMTADLYPNGDHILKTSSHHYEALWVTVAAINILDLIQRGYFQEAAAYLDPFLDASRRRPVPNTGDSFDSSRGFITGPSEYLPPTWLSDNGAVLWVASEYYLITRDQTFLKKWMPTMMASIEWIARERGLTKLRGGPNAGLLPPSRSSDISTQGSFYWNDAWNYRGLASVCRVLEATHSPQAERWGREREDYRETFQKAIREQIKRTIRWQDRAGNMVPSIPMRLGQVDASGESDTYLDTGPMFLGVAGLLNPDDEVMTWALKWLTEGPNANTEFPDWSDFSQPSCLRYEMSSGEPCYSWNIYLRYLRNERLQFLEGFYSLVAGAVSRKFLGGVETRDGIQDLPITNAVIDNHLRNMLVFENESGRGIDLLRNSPSAWLEPEKEIRVKDAQTHFGPLSLHVKTGTNNRVVAEVDPPRREAVDWIRLHLYHPQGRPLRRAVINSSPVTPAAGNVIEVRNPRQKITVEASF